MVLDTGAVTRGSGSKNEDRERNIRKWFVERDLIDGVILLPDNLFYNTSAAGIIVVLSKRKPEARRGKIVLVNASRRVGKGRPKNYIPEEDIRPIAAAFLKGEPVDGEVAVITREQAQEADYNLSPSRWVGQANSTEVGSVRDLLAELATLDNQVNSSPHHYPGFFQGSSMSLLDTEFAEGRQWLRLGDAYEITKKPRGLDIASLPAVPFVPMDAIPQGGTYAPDYTLRQPSEIRSGTYFERGDVLVAKITPSLRTASKLL